MLLAEEAALDEIILFEMDCKILVGRRGVILSTAGSSMFRATAKVVILLNRR